MNRAIILMSSILLLLSCSRKGVERLELQGNVEVREMRLGFEVPGRIIRLATDEGQHVIPGQLLAELEPDYYVFALGQMEATLQARKANLSLLESGSRPEEIRVARANSDAAKAVVVNAQKEHERAKSLLNDGVISQGDFDKYQSAKDQAEANLKAMKEKQRLAELGFRVEEIEERRALVAQAESSYLDAKKKVADTKLLSPGSGVVQTRAHEQGDYVTTGECVFTISIIDPVWVRAYVNETDLGRVRPGMNAIVKTDDGKTYQGQLGFISPSAEFTPKSVQTKDIRTDLVYRVRVVLPNLTGNLRQGMPVTVELELN